MRIKTITEQSFDTTLNVPKLARLGGTGRGINADDMLDNLDTIIGAIKKVVLRTGDPEVIISVTLIGDTGYVSATQEEPS